MSFDFSSIDTSDTGMDPFVMALQAWLTSYNCSYAEGSLDAERTNANHYELTVKRSFIMMRASFVTDFIIFLDHITSAMNITVSLIPQYPTRRIAPIIAADLSNIDDLFRACSNPNILSIFSVGAFLHHSQDHQFEKSAKPKVPHLCKLILERSERIRTHIDAHTIFAILSMMKIPKAREIAYADNIACWLITEDMKYPDLYNALKSIADKDV